MPGEDISSVIQKIELKLEMDWSPQLASNTKKWEKFIDKAQTSTRGLGKSLTSMQQELMQASDNMFKGSQKHIEKLSAFANSSLQSVSKSASRILKTVEIYQKTSSKYIDENTRRMQQAFNKIQSLQQQAASGMLSSEQRGKAYGQIKQLAQQIESFANLNTKLLNAQDARLAKMLGRHYNMISESVRKKSKAVTTSIDRLIKDTLNRFKQIQSQTKFMGKVPAVIHEAGGLKVMEQQQKIAFANLKQLAEAHAKAQMVFNEQVRLKNKAVNEEAKKHHIELAAVAKKNMDKIKTEYTDAVKKVKRFTLEIQAQKREMAKKGMDISQQMRDQLKPSRMKPIFDRMFVNLKESALLAGKGMQDALMKSTAQGDKLRGQLQAFKDRLVAIKEQAAILSKMGLIDPKVVGPKIKAAERQLKEFYNAYKKMQSDIARYSSKGMAKFRVPELGDLNKTRQQMRELKSDFAKTRQVTEANFEALHRNFVKMKSLFEQHVRQRRAARKKIEAIEQEAKNIQIRIATETDAAMRTIMERQVKRLKAHAANLRKVLERPVAMPIGKIEAFSDKFVNVVKRTVSRANALTRDIKLVPRRAFGELEAQYKKTIALIERSSKKRFFRTGSIKEAQKETKKLTTDVRKYKDLIITLEKELKNLQMMQRRGFRGEGVRQATAEVKQQIAGMKRFVSQINSMHSHAVRRMRSTARTSTKSMLRSGWEMIRNFRWQVAAIIYLITRAIRAVQRVFMDTMNEIAKFRRDAMALAAQYSFKMFGDMKQNFRDAYKFSRDLMMKLEIVAAETILTLDDVLMLTKTFAQAGIIPRTDEDLKRIATIGTAIKALTEGMANAGVQMKQELYAIIAGRQRATDQLAMMFKLMGQDIQKMIDEGKTESKEMIEVLADALKPFQTMNEALKVEWEAIINKLKIVWKMIKRIALEESLLQSTKALSNFIDSFWTKAEGLTEKGRMVAAVMRGGFEVARAVVFAIWEAIKQIFIMLGQITNVVMTLVGVTSQVDTNVEAASQSMKGLLMLMEGLLKATWLVKHTVIAILAPIEAILATVNYIVEAFKAMGAYAGWAALKVATIFTISGKMRDALNEAAEKQYQLGEATYWSAHKRLNQAGIALRDLVKNANMEYKEVEKTIDSILDKLKKINKEQGKLGKEFKLTYPTGIFDEWYKMQGEMQRAEAAQYKGPKRFQVEYKQRVAALETLKMKTKKNLSDFAEMWAAYNKKEFEMTEKQVEGFKIKWQAHRKVLGDVRKYELYLLNELNRKTEEWNQKEAIALAKRKRKYEQFVRDTLQVPMTPEQKALDWYEKVKIDVKELVISSEFFANNIDYVNKIMKEGLEIRKANAITEMNLEAEKFINKASKADAWNNVFDELNIEFAEYVRQVEKSNKLDEDKKNELREQLGLIKEQRIVQEQLNLVHETYLKQLDVQQKKADIMKAAFSPIKQREAEIKSLQITHNREMARMQKEMDEWNNQWKENGEWKKEATQAVKDYGDATEEMMRQMTIATERELQKKQMPIWNDLVEASKGWADGFTDALANIVDGVDSVSEALNALQQQILKDVLRVVIKRTVTDNLMDMLGTGFMGEETPLQKWFGVGGKESKGAQEVTAKKPLPVTIVNTEKFEEMKKGLIGEDIPELGEGMGQPVSIANTPIPVYIVNEVPGFEKFGTSLANKMQGTTDAVSNNTDAINQGNAGIVNAILRAAAMGGGSIGAAAGGLFGMVSGLFSGGSIGAAAGEWAGSFGMTELPYRGHGFAEGGIIEEPIIGQGLKSGEVYHFGEKTKYGEDEIISPIKKLQKAAPQNKYSYSMPINISAIDTQSGIEFLMKHSDVIQGQMIRNLKKNKPIRRGIQKAY
jgi:hypothetical protein